VRQGEDCIPDPVLREAAENGRRAALEAWRRARELGQARASAASARHAAYALGGVGLGLAAGSGVIALFSARQNGVIKAGGFATADDLTAAFQTGQTLNVAAIAMAVMAGILEVVAIPLGLANRDPGKGPP
jgi:hypothetical protein